VNRKQLLNREPLRTFLFHYGLAILAVAIGWLLRTVMTMWFGPGLPTFITFYPAVIMVALLAGPGPGLLATALVIAVVVYSIMPPLGELFIASSVDGVALVLFGGMGLFISAVAEFYRRNRVKAAAYDRELVLRETMQEKEFLANLLERASQPFAVSYPDGRLGMFNQAFANLTGYTTEELRSLDWSTALTPPEWRALEKTQLDELQRTGEPVRYEKEYVRKDGTRVPIELFVHLVRDAEGKPEYYYSFIADITERKQAEEALRKGQDRLSTIYATMTDGLASHEIVYADGAAVDYLITDVNPAFENITGIPWAAAVGKMATELYGPGSAPYLEVYARVAAEGKPETFETYFPPMRKHLAVSVFSTGRGKFSTVFSDITERKQAVEKLATSEALLRAVLDGTPDPVFLKDCESRLLLANPATLAVIGKPVETCIGKTDEEFYDDPADGRAIMANDRRIMASGQTETVEETVSTPSGPRHYLSTKVPHRDAAGNIIGLIGIARDITERKRAERALRESEERFRLALRHAPVSIAIQDRDFRYIWAYNQRTAKHEEIIGRLDSDIFTAEETAHIQAFKRRVIEEDVELREEMWFNRPNGRIFLEIYWEPIHDDAGKVIGVGSATVDLTRIKVAEDELRQIATNLRTTNTELLASRAAALNLMEDADAARRKAEEISSDLRESEERIKASLSEKEVLLKEIHHRVKNNMQVISSLVALQANELQDTTMREVLNDVTYRVRSMALVHEKLYQSADLARIDFAEYVGSLLGYLWRAHGPAVASVRLSLDLEPVTLPVDIAVPCGLILNELAGNSLKHAFPDQVGGEVVVSLKGATNGLVSLAVRDSGVGLPEGFDWRQAHSLGLRLVQMLARQLDATVEVSSGEGTGFEVTFSSPPRGGVD